ncbi:teichoic acid biosynthesis protein [Bacillus halotolerans]|uniref:phage baseplate protein n=1 Tax=Bacillus halotolerans TaxID=260554 RepID=UPI00192B4EC7|nr:teichoic acid biosynthesis protein [Bacillus halotolerans]MBL4966669.1 teichoic acid biosynthesis protein [Bacillus halotolerans]
MAQKELFNFTKITPKLFTELRVADKTVLQSFNFDEKNHQIYTTQVATGMGGGSPQSFRITRLSFEGLQLDSMLLKHGGHGTNIGIENRNGTIYIWSLYDRPNETDKSDLVCFPYKAGATLDENSKELQRFSNLPLNHRVTPALDMKNRQLALRQYDTVNNKQWVTVFNLDDAIANKNNPLYTINIPEELHYLQGFFLDDGYLYWYTGDTNSKTYPNLITVFDTSGKILLQKEITIGSDLSYRYENNFREPEGICMYTNPETGAKSLMVAITSGKEGSRISRIYAYHSYENFMNHVPIIRTPLLKTVGHQEKSPERFQPFIQTFILEYNAQNKKWVVPASGYLPSYTSNVVQNITINTEGNLQVNLNERYISLLHQAIEGDFRLKQKDIRMGSWYFAGGEKSNVLEIGFIKGNTKIRPDDAAIPNGSRMSVFMIVADKIEV